jgi:hypothetical protein
MNPLLKWRDSLLKFLQIHTFYDAAITDIYRPNGRDLESASFDIQTEAMLRHGFTATHLIAPYMKQMGYESQIVVANNRHSQSAWLREQGIQEPWDKFGAVKRQVETWKPDILYIGCPVEFDSKFIRSLSYRPSLVMGWKASTITDPDWSEYDVMLSGLSKIREIALEKGAKNAAHFLPGFPVGLSRYAQVVPRCDVVFAGQAKEQYQKKRNRLIGLILNADKWSVGLYIHGGAAAKYGVEMLRALRSGRISLDAQSEISYQGEDITGGETSNARIFESTGCGVFLLTEHRTNLSEMFSIGTEIETFRDDEELLDKIDYYIKNPDERESIARRGMLRCFADHSMRRRAARMNQIIQEHLPPVAQIHPVSRKFGYDRGRPIDRYYIEKFLNANQQYIQGVGLEAGSDTYLHRFSDKVHCYDILGVEPSENITLLANLATGANIPHETYDCIILTQTIQMIYHCERAVQNAINALKEGGTLLLTASGISQISRYDMDRWGEFWRFTDRCMERLLERAAYGCDVEVVTYGNVAVAKAFLDGRAAQELGTEVLDFNDNDYQVVVCARVTKA